MRRACHLYQNVRLRSGPTQTSSAASGSTNPTPPGVYLSIALASMRFLFTLNDNAESSRRKNVASFPSSPSPPHLPGLPPSREHSATTSPYTPSTACKLTRSSSYAARPPISVSSRSHASARLASAASCAPDPTSSMPENSRRKPWTPPRASYSSSLARRTLSAHRRSGDASPSCVRCASFTAACNPSAFTSASRREPGMSHSSSSMHPGSAIFSSSLPSTQKPNRSKSSSLA
mmetsp:Transcript_13523/g.59097  ORF Transcript_13523/g.59097 Transcript_13523/m.59097 type:complete len:233 (+) Transcript_13523:710-1408(+)